MVSIKTNWYYRIFVNIGSIDLEDEGENEEENVY